MSTVQHQARFARPVRRGQKRMGRSMAETRAETRAQPGLTVDPRAAVLCYGRSAEISPARAAGQDGTDSTTRPRRTHMAADPQDRRPCLARLDHMGWRRRPGWRSCALHLAARHGPGAGVHPAHHGQPPRCHAPLPEAGARVRAALKTAPGAARRTTRHSSFLLLFVGNFSMEDSAVRPRRWFGRATIRRGRQP